MMSWVFAGLMIQGLLDAQHLQGHARPAPHAGLEESYEYDETGIGPASVRSTRLTLILDLVLFASCRTGGVIVSLFVPRDSYRGGAVDSVKS